MDVFSEETLGVYALTVTPTAGGGDPLTVPGIRVTNRGIYIHDEKQQLELKFELKYFYSRMPMTVVD